MSSKSSQFFGGVANLPLRPAKFDPQSVQWFAPAGLKTEKVILMPVSMPVLKETRKERREKQPMNQRLRIHLLGDM